MTWKSTVSSACAPDAATASPRKHIRPMERIVAAAIIYPRNQMEQYRKAWGDAQCDLRGFTCNGGKLPP
jgi:hypothetical protein